MKRTFVIEVETDEDTDPEDAESDIGTFRDALVDGSLLEAAARNLPTGKGYPELGSLKVEVKHEIGQNRQEQEYEGEEASGGKGPENPEASGDNG